MNDPNGWFVRVQQMIADASSKFWLERSSMLHKVFTVYDSKAQVYMQPFYMRADGEAQRAFRMSIAKPGHQFSDYPADYTLFCIGDFDDDNGRFFQYDTFVNLGNGVQHLPAQPVDLPKGEV